MTHSQYGINRRSFGPALLALASARGYAQGGFPSKPMTWIVPFAGGGGLDILARPIAQRASIELGQPIVIENRPGAGGTIAASAFVRSAADGYTLFHGSNGTHGIGPALYETAKFDPLKDFIPITRLTAMGMLIVVNANSSITNLRQLLADLKLNPGARTYASGGSGSLQHMAGELFKSATDTSLQHVPFRGAAPAQVELLAGRIDMMFDTTNNAAEQIKSGKLRPIALLSELAKPWYPQVESVASAGINDLDVVAWDALFAPASTSRVVVDRLNSAVTTALKSPEVRDLLMARGVTPTPTSPDQAMAFLRTEVPRWAAAVKKSGARAE
jgi:tripartite-type tricarboxylate transporter receptor subunit TctC